MSEEAALSLRTRTLIKMGVPFDDPRFELSLTQLYIWPQLLFSPKKGDDGKYLIEVRIDDVTRTVDFNLVLDEVPEGNELKQRCSALVSWCQQLMGEDWSVRISNRNSARGKYKTFHVGDRRKPIEVVVKPIVDAPFPEVVTNFRRYSSTGKSLGFDYDIPLDPILPVDPRR
jgi:hypothetical protein